MNFTKEELYAIERLFDSMYSQMLDKSISLDKTRVEINCFMDKENPERTELLRKNKENEEMVYSAFKLYYDIAKKCEKERIDGDKK